MGELWPLLVIAGLGAFHGANPAMGWLFAVALGMQDGDRRSVLRALPVIVIGHELALVPFAVLVVGLGALARPQPLQIGAAALLVAFGVFRFWKPRAHPRWTTMRVSSRELGFWAFLMASAHGAGLMVVPVLIGGATSDAHARDHGGARADELASLGVGEAAVALLLHGSVMLLVMGAIALLVYEKLGLAVLRTAWLNIDRLWAASFLLAAVVTLLT
jgi:hypothetical protein